MSPTTMSATGSWMTCAPRTTWNFCSCSMRLCKPLNCFSLLQSLKAVTRTTQTTDSRIAAPSIQPASASPSSSAPAFAAPQAAERDTRQEVRATLPHNRFVRCYCTSLLLNKSSIKTLPQTAILRGPSTNTVNTQFVLTQTNEVCFTYKSIVPNITQLL